MSKGRVLVDALNASTGGGLSRLADIAIHAPPSGEHELLIVARRIGARVIAGQREDMPVYCLPRVFEPPLARFAWHAAGMGPWAAMRRVEPSVLYCPYNYSPTIWPTSRPRLVVTIESLAPYAPEIRSTRSGLAARRLELIKLLTDRTIARADRVFVLSKQAWPLIGAELLANKTEVLPIPPPTITRRPSSPARPLSERPYLLVLGDLYRHKGLETILNALRLRPPGRRPFVRFVGAAADEAYVGQLLSLRQRYGLQACTTFEGPASREGAAALLAEAEACILASRFENLARVPVEAMALGTPLIASDIPSFREACEEAALYFRTGSAAELMEAIDALLGDSSLRSVLVERGSRRVAPLRAGQDIKTVMTAISDLQ